MARSPAARAVDDRALDLVSAREELALEVRDEDPEVGIVRARVHLGDEEDPQRRLPARRPGGSRGTSRRSCPRPRGRSAASSARRGRRACRLLTSWRHVTRTTSPGSAFTGRRQRVRVLPVEVPARDVEQDLARAACPGFSSSRIDAPSRCMWPAATWIVVGVEMRRSHVETALGARGGGGPAAQDEEAGRRERGRRPVLPREVEERLVAVAEPPLLALRTRELHRPGQEHRLQRRRAPPTPARRSAARGSGRARGRSAGCSAPASRSGFRPEARRPCPRGGGCRPSRAPRRRSSSRCSASRRCPTPSPAGQPGAAEAGPARPGRSRDRGRFAAAT